MNHIFLVSMGMNGIEKAIMHVLFSHLHHNIDKSIDFKEIDALNRKAGKLFPKVLLVGPGDDAAAFKSLGRRGSFVGKMESHCSPCAPKPYDAAATVARPLFVMNFLGAKPLKDKVIVGSCGFAGTCT